jgi:hypothetical protein
MDFPYADKIADRMYKMLPPELKDQNKDQLPPQVQQTMKMASDHIQQQDQLIAQMQDKLKELEEKDEHEDLKLSIDAYNAETNRMKVILPIITPIQGAEVAASTVAEIQQQTPITANPQDEMAEKMPVMPQNMPQQAMNPQQQ